MTENMQNKGSGYIQILYSSIRSIQIRLVLAQFITLAMVLASAFLMWKVVMLYSASESPLVVVLSGSMEPAFKRGDLVFLSMSNAPYRAGEIVVYKIDGREIPIIHRIIKVHEDNVSGEAAMLTKGDNNFGDDTLLYAKGQRWLNSSHIAGRASGFLPYLGWITIIMTDHPFIKYILIGALGLLFLVVNE